MASLFEVDAVDAPVRLLDPGAGVGSLTAAFVDRWRDRDTPLHITAIELDEGLHPSLELTLARCRERGVEGELIAGDFLSWAHGRTGRRGSPAMSFDYCIMNPPYRKVRTNSAERRLLADVGVDVTNLYTAFVALAARLLREGGQLVAITPRSFANGPYFRSFRRDFLSHMAFRHIHVYDTRDTAFADSEVLQENVVFHAVKTTVRGPVRVTSSHSSADGLLVTRDVPHDVVVRPDDPELFVHLANDDIAVSVANRMNRLSVSLRDVGLAVSTGRVVDFRTRPNLRDEPASGTAPLVYPNHFHQGRVRWPLSDSRKPNALAVNDETASLLLPNGVYVLVKRFTAKEERRRVVAVVADTDRLPGPWVAFENHLNVFHVDNGPVGRDVAVGLAAFLNCTVVDLFFRQWSGHTQVNATDLRALRYPTRSQLAALGAAVGSAHLSQEKTDALVVQHVPELDERKRRGDLLVAHQRITEAQDVLRQLGLPVQQTNERSALTLLALLDLTPDKQWSDVEAPMRGITPMMQFMAEHYGKRYAPNTRETVRRQTVHQFVAAGNAVANPDNPGRPTNSGKTVYQIPAELIALLSAYGTEMWEEALNRWREVVPALRDRWAKEREMAMIPVTLSDGAEVVLSPGGQNPLIKAIIDDFCSRFAPGGRVLYLGDARDKWRVVLDYDALSDFGFHLDAHGKMPDVVVYDAGNNRLLLIEAVNSGGTVDAKRHDELLALFDDSESEIVCVTAFMDRRSLGSKLGGIGWGTKVWLAEAPTHMIHFDDDRPLAP